MKTILWLILVLALIIFAARPKLNFNPFSVTFETPYFAIGIAFLLIGLSLIQYESYKRGVKEGLNHTIEKLEKLSEE